MSCFLNNCQPFHKCTFQHLSKRGSFHHTPITELGLLRIPFPYQTSRKRTRHWIHLDFPTWRLHGSKRWPSLGSRVSQCLATRLDTHWRLTDCISANGAGSSHQTTGRPLGSFSTKHFVFLNNSVIDCLNSYGEGESCLCACHEVILGGRGSWGFTHAGQLHATAILSPEKVSPLPN